MAVETESSTKRGDSVKGGSASLRVLQITDTHLFADTAATLAGVATDSTQVAVIERMLADYWPVDCILATGDLVHDGSERGYRRFRRNFEALGVRTLVIPGNHDDPVAMARVFDRGRVSWSSHAILGNWQFLMLDSFVQGSSGGRLGEPQLCWLDEHLSRYAGEHALVALHHHPVTVGSRWLDDIGLEDGEAMLEVLARHPQVRAVVWGHVHQSFSAEYRGIRLLGCPSTCIQFRPESSEFALDERNAGFRWLELFADGRLATGVSRVEQAPDIDLRCEGYR